MKILLLTQVLPYPPDSGPKVKTWNVIKYLAPRHEVTLASFVRGDQSADVAHLASVCRAVHTVPMERNLAHDGLAAVQSLASGQPWMMVRDRRAAMAALIRRLAASEQFDIVHADQLNMAQYAQQVPGARRILDAHNALWVLYGRLAAQMKWGPQRLILERDWRLLKRYEGRMVATMDGVLAVSEEDRSALLMAAGRAHDVTVIPIAVDTDEIAPVQRHADADHLLHVGTMYWPPNIDGINWFLDEIMPTIVRQRPGTVFDVVGARPPESLLARAQEDHHLNVTGYVVDTLPYLQSAGVFLVPLRAGGGMRVKILNALAQGMPIISTTLGAEGIAVRDGEHLLLADDPADFGAAVLRVLHDPALAARLGAAGRRLAEEQYDYRVACAPMDALYRRCLAG